MHYPDNHRKDRRSAAHGGITRIVQFVACCLLGLVITGTIPTPLTAKAETLPNNREIIRVKKLEDLPKLGKPIIYDDDGKHHQSQYQGSKRILVISSYHTSYEWSQDEFEGVQEFFHENVGVYINYYNEFLDSRRFPVDLMEKELRDILLLKYSDYDFDAVVALDDNAINFCLKHRQELFPGVPFLFAGVNRLHPVVTGDFKKVAGVVEDFRMDRYLDILLKLHPQKRRICVIVGDSATAMSHKAIFMESVARHPSIEVVYFQKTDLPNIEIPEEIKQFDDGKTIFVFIEWDSHILTERVPLGSTEFAQAVEGPLYSTYSPPIPNGPIAGGRGFSGLPQGKMLGWLIDAVLRGSDVDELPILFDSQERIILNYPELKRNQANLSAIPDDVEFIGKPAGLFSGISSRGLGWLIGIIALQALLLIVIGITWRLRYLKQQKEIENFNHLRRLFDAINDAVIVHDLKGNIMECNPAASERLGYTREEFLQMNTRDIDSPEFAQGFAERLDNQLKSNNYQVEGIHVAKNGERINVEIHSTTITVGHHRMVVTVARDITRRIRQQKETEEARQQLKRVNEQLEEALESANQSALEAKFANQAKTEFLANMSHEIRTPMNAIVGMTSLLLESRLDDEQRDCAATVLKCADALLEIINELLDYSRLESDSLQLEMTDFPFTDLVREIEAYYEQKAEEKSITLKVDVDPRIPDVLTGDSAHLRQITANLLENAIKFTQEGSVHLQFYPEKIMNRRIVLHGIVTDTGIGIPPENMKHLFEPFYQVDSSNTRNYGGTGIGLSLCKRLTEKMHGSIWCNSRLGKGSEFHFTVTLDICGEEESEKQLPTLFPDRALELTPQVIIISMTAGIEDHPNVTSYSFLREIARQSGHFCDVYHMPSDAVERLRSLPPAPKQPYIVVLSLADQKFIEHSPENRQQLYALADVMGGGGCGLIIVQPVETVAYPQDSEDGVPGESARLKWNGVFHRIRHLRQLSNPVNPMSFRECLKDMAVNIMDDPRPLEADTEGRIAAYQLPEKNSNTWNVLLVEDNPGNQTVGSKILERLGHAVDIAANGVEAIEALEQKRYDVVLMDIQMPQMDGLEATRIIRSAYSNVLDHDVPILALTAHALESDREMCLDAGMNAFCAKPLQSKTLVASIEQVIRNGDAGASSAKN